MNVANLELCKELYKLSGWDETPIEYCQYQNYSSPLDQRHIVHTTLETVDEVLKLQERGYIYQLETFPAYNLGYLLRKLPKVIFTYNLALWVNGESWQADYVELSHEGYADTPEDAVAKLAIELFKQGVLTKEKQL